MTGRRLNDRATVLSISSPTTENALKRRIFNIIRKIKAVDFAKSHYSEARTFPSGKLFLFCKPVFVAKREPGPRYSVENGWAITDALCCWMVEMLRQALRFKAQALVYGRFPVFCDFSHKCCLQREMWMANLMALRLECSLSI